MKLKVGSNLNKRKGSIKATESSRRGFSYLRRQKKGFNGSKRQMFSSTPSVNQRKKKVLKIIGSLVGVLFGLGIVAAIIGGVVVAAYLGKISASLPDPGTLVSRDSERSSKIYDKDGKLLYTVYGDYNREFVPLEKIPKHVQWAVLAAEDIEFYEHKGVDLAGLAKSVFDYAFRGRPLRGASTISQQLTRNTVLVDLMGEDAFERNITRKLKEMLITMKMEQKLTKDQILELYLNEIPLGGVNYGFQTGAKAHFDKSVQNLTLDEAALLAGIIRSPTGLSPLTNGDEELSKGRRDEVLDLMEKYQDRIEISEKDEDGNFIVRKVTEEDIAQAKQAKLDITPGEVTLKAPHFIFYVLDQLEREYGPDMVKNGGLQVKTSLDYSIQKVAENEVKKNIKKFKVWYGAHNGALVAINPRNGHILAMVGSVDYNKRKDKRVDGNVNVTTSPRQMGSAVKSITYLTAFNQGYNPGTLAPDIPLNFGNYKLTNWDKGHRGLMSMRTALNLSRNVPAAYTLQLVGGVDSFINTAERLGITTLKDRSRYGLSLTLGAGEMKLLELTNAYAAYANKGVQYPATAILEVKDREGNEVYKYNPEDHKKKVFSEQEVYQLNWILCQMGGRKDKLASQMYQVPGQQLCGKTGTTDGPKDLTAFMYYPRLTVGVWTGNNNGKETFGSLGQGWSTNVPLPIARNFMERVQPKFGKEWYVQPSGIVNGTVCKDTGLLASGDCGAKESSVFVSGHLPPKDEAHKKLPICKKNNKIATNETEARQLGLIKDKVFLDFKLQNEAQQTSYNKYMKKRGFGIYSQKPEEAVCPLGLGDDDAPVVTITSPSDGSSHDAGDTINIKASVAALDGVKQVTFYFGSSQIHSTTSSPYEYSYSIPSSTSAGNYTIKVTAVDNEDRLGSSQIQIYVDNDEDVNISVSATPQSSISFPPGSTFRANLSGSDVGNVTSVAFYVETTGGSPVASVTGSKSSSILWTGSWTSNPGSGNYIMYGIAETASGNYKSSNISLNVD